ncbi:uncharacterized protein LOC134715628 isoform X1 [Mytilus trossulus]|uniref:uncharacterized protein LOC134715628 isoform X1 n=1 Tax=Mytilus trossulus TaxID=6551 RepID=UPI00300660C1
MAGIEQSLVKELQVVMSMLEWQQDIYKYITENNPTTGNLVWVYHNGGTRVEDEISWFRRYLLSTKDAVYYDNGVYGNTGTKALHRRMEVQTNDIKYRYSKEEFVIMNVKDSSNINYVILEALKDGIYFSPKWQSCTRMFPTPHVIVFSRKMPDENFFPSYKYKVFTI